MPETVEVIRNFDLVEEIGDAIDSIDYDELMLRGIQIIKDKTESGVDYQNRPFRKYSKDYEETRLQKQLPINKVDLFFTGNMMSAITADSDNDGAVIKFLNKHDSGKAFSHIRGSGSLPVRDFFFFDDDDMDELLDMAMSFVDDEL